MNLHWHETGLSLSYEQGVLEIHDINPETTVRSRMSRWEMLRLGFLAIAAGLRP